MPLNRAEGLSPQVGLWLFKQIHRDHTQSSWYRFGAQTGLIVRGREVPGAPWAPVYLEVRVASCRPALCATRKMLSSSCLSPDLRYGLG